MFRSRDGGFLFVVREAVEFCSWSPFRERKRLELKRGAMNRNAVVMTGLA
jgi:hypothetical protein